MPEHTALSQIDTEEGTSAPTAFVISTATASGLSATVSYTAGSGAHATSLRLLWKITGVDADFRHSTPVIFAGQTVGPFVAGQTVDFKTRAENSVGSTDSAVKTVSFKTTAPAKRGCACSGGLRPPSGGRQPCENPSN